MMNWTEQNNKLTKQFERSSFSEIVNLLNELAEISNKMDHHPDFSVYAYKKIRFNLYTHDMDGITNKDYQLAQEIDRIFNS